KADDTLLEAMGGRLATSYIAVKELDIEAFASADEAFECRQHSYKYGVGRSPQRRPDPTRDSPCLVEDDRHVAERGVCPLELPLGDPLPHTAPGVVHQHVAWRDAVQRHRVLIGTAIGHRLAIKGDVMGDLVIAPIERDPRHDRVAMEQ